MRRPLPGWLAGVSVPIAWSYRLALRARNRRYDAGRGVRSLPVPVISVGNLVVGGAGKTPMVAHLARLLTVEGHRPLIAMRGYAARPRERSDEEAEYAMRLPEIPVVAHPDRHAAAIPFLARHPEIDCVLLDDGFQHRRLARDLDLVLVDASRRTFGEPLIPAGNLREPTESLRRADAVVVTRAEAGKDQRLARQIERAHGRPPVAWSRHVWTDLDVHAPAARREPVPWLAGKRVVTMLGVDHPRPILDQLEAAAAEVVARVPARDHEHYGRAKVDAALAEVRRQRLDALVVTGKDWVKLQTLAPPGGWPVPVVVPRLALEVFEGARALERLVLGVVERPAATV